MIAAHPSTVSSLSSRLLSPYATALALEGRYAEAEEWLNVLIERDPRPAGFCLLGKIYAQQGESEKATASFNEALRLDPDCTDARAALECVRAGKMSRSLLAQLGGRHAFALIAAAVLVLAVVMLNNRFAMLEESLTRLASRDDLSGVSRELGRDLEKATSALASQSAVSTLSSDLDRKFGMLSASVSTLASKEALADLTQDMSGDLTALDEKISGMASKDSITKLSAGVSQALTVMEGSLSGMATNASVTRLSADLKSNRTAMEATISGLASRDDVARLSDGITRDLAGLRTSVTGLASQRALVQLGANVDREFSGMRATLSDVTYQTGLTAMAIDAAQIWKFSFWFNGPQRVFPVLFCGDRIPSSSESGGRTDKPEPKSGPERAPGGTADTVPRDAR